MALNQGAEVSRGDELWFAELGRVHALALLLHGQHIQALKQGGLPLNKPMELVLQQGGQGVGEGGEQHPGYQMHWRAGRSRSFSSAVISGQRPWSAVAAMRRSAGSLC